jgi:hypothetical protein
MNQIIAMSEIDCDREPFISEAFLELLTDLIEDDHSRNLHNTALAVAHSLYRILRAGEEWYDMACVIGRNSNAIKKSFKKMINCVIIFH